MRIPGLLIFLVLAITVPGMAADGPQSSTSSITLDVSTNPDVPDAQSFAAVTGGVKSELSRRGNGPTENFNDAMCATMRTYVMARERPGSDVTRVVGYSRCQPAWKFQLRTADEKVPDRSR
jgi:hypothetical protein